MDKSSSFRSWLFRTIVIFAVLAALYRFGDRWLRQVLLFLSTSPIARQVVSGSALARGVSQRFVAGENIEAAVAATRDLNSQGLRVTLDYLGENVVHESDASAARQEILHLLDAIHQDSLDATVSIKLSQLGLNLSESLALDNLSQLLERARQYQNKIRIDMESSDTIDQTLHIYRVLRNEHGYDNVGVVIQSYLYRSEQDVRQLIEEGAWIRLCKGAYAEPSEIAFPVKADTDANFVRLMHMMLSPRARERGVYLGVATHDEHMIRETIAFARAHDIPATDFEFQMLYGVRRELQLALVRSGYQMRVYVPYGLAWYPYFMRRLAERPANLWFFLSNLLRS